MSDNPLALCGVKKNPGDVTNALQAIESAGYTVVAPGGTTLCPTLPDGYAVGVTAIRFAKDDTYVMDRVTCLKAGALNRLARGVGISWLPAEFRRLDDQRDSNYCSMVVAGECRDYTGEMIKIAGTRTVDLRDGSAEAANMKGAQLARARANISQICETKAKNRAIADACVGRSIHPDQLNREFVMAKVYRVAAHEGEATAAENLAYGPPPGHDQTEEPRHVDAEVVSVAGSDGLRIPNSPKFGDDADKLLSEASKVSLNVLAAACADKLADEDRDRSKDARLNAWFKGAEAELKHREARAQPASDGGEW